MILQNYILMLSSIGFWTYFFVSSMIFWIMRFIVDAFLKLRIKKRAILITVLIAIVHSIISGLIAFYMMVSQDYSAHHFLCGFSAAYFLCDFIQIIFMCEPSSNNRFVVIHHICAQICIACSVMFPDMFPVDVGIYIVASELTMPSINLQWIIDTYCEKQKYEGFYKLLLIYNLVIYFIYRIVVTYYGFWQMIIRGLVVQSLCTVPFVIFNAVWFTMLVRKFKGSSIEVL